MYTNLSQSLLAAWGELAVAPVAADFPEEVGSASQTATCDVHRAYVFVYLPVYSFGWSCRCQQSKLMVRRSSFGLVCAYCCPWLVTATLIVHDPDE
jgi:hypothetical protein